MKDSFSWLTPKQAGVLTGYTARHVQNLITKGKLSATKEDGKYYIDKAELFRVFPSAHRKEQEGNSSQQASEKERLAFENNILKESSIHKDKEIEFLRNQIEFVSNEKVKMLDAIVNQTKLLDHKFEKVQAKKSSIKSRLKDIFSIKK